MRVCNCFVADSTKLKGLDSMDATDFTDSTDLTDPAEYSAKAVESVESVESVRSVESVKSVGTVWSVAPSRTKKAAGESPAAGYGWLVWKRRSTDGVRVAYG